MTSLHLDPGGLHAADLAPPRSKSDAQRALVLAHALDDEGFATLSLEEPGLPGDVRALGRGLLALRAMSSSLGVNPNGGRASTPPHSAPIDCGDGGAPLRFLVGQAAAMPGLRVQLVGSPRLAERPHDALLSALRSALGPAGLRIEETRPGLFPLTIQGPEGMAAVPRFSIRAAESSQFATSLLLTAVALARREQRAWQVELEGPLASEGYLALTLDWMARAGVEVTRDGAIYTVFATRGPARRGPVPGDWSSLGYLLPIVWRSGGRACLVDPSITHPDRAILDVLLEAGLTVAVDDAGRASVRGTARRGVAASGARCPDLLPTVAALACVLPGPSTLHEVSILRLKESDRLSGIEALVTAAGGRLVPLEGDAVRIEPGRLPASLSLSSRGDHRLAMAAATLAVLSGARLSLDGPEVVDKSFPAFWDTLRQSGVTVVEMPNACR